MANEPQNLEQDEGSGIAFKTQEELDAFVAKAAKPLIERAIKARLKDRPAADELEQQLAKLQAEKEALEDERRSELEKAQKRAQKAEESRAAAEAKASADIKAAMANFHHYRIRSEILGALPDLNKGRGAPQIAELTRSLFCCDNEGNVTAEDKETGKPLTVKERLAAWLTEPGNEIYMPPPPPGSGGRPGAPPTASTGDDGKPSGQLVREGWREMKSN